MPPQTEGNSNARTGPERPAVHPLEGSLTIVGALGCLLITIVVWGGVSAYQATWPLPALYFIEVAVLSVAGAWMFLRAGRGGISVLWAAIGVLVAFSILGAFSVGLLYVPTALLLVIPAISYDVRNRQPIAVHLGVCLAAAVVQAAVMFGVIGLLRY